MAPYLGLRGRKLTGLISLVSGLCFFLFGYDQGDFGSLLTVPAFRRQFPQLDTIGNPSSRHTTLVQGAANASWNAGCIISAICTIWVGGYLGRRKTIILGLCFLVVGEIIQTSSYRLGQLIAGRVIAGIGNGFTTATIPSYQAETTRAHRRGTHLMVSAAFIAAGASLSYWLTFAFAYVDNTSAEWRVPIAFQLVFALPILLIVAFLPESPRWLVLTGRADAALTTLAALNDADAEDLTVYKEFLAIKDTMLQVSAGGFRDVFTQGTTRHLHRTLLACTIQAFQQLSGINLIIQYVALVLLQQFGYSPWLARLLAACIGTESLIACLVPIIGIDRFWGRRSLLIFGAAGMCASLAVIAAMAWLRGTAGSIVGVVFIFVYVSFFNIGWLGMSWLYSVEVVPLKIRGPATALSTAINWLMNFWVVLVTPVALHDIGWRTFIIFVVTNAVIGPVVWLFFPECAYRTLEEMDVIFHAAALSQSPYTTVVRDSREAPLWYGRDGTKEYDYEGSEWHQRKVRWSDEVATSSDGSRGGDSGMREKKEGGNGSGGSGSGSGHGCKGSGDSGSGSASDEDLVAVPPLDRERAGVTSRNDMPAGHPMFYKAGRVSRSSGRA